MRSEKLPVVFRKYRQADRKGEVVAVFPTLVEQHNMRTCYSHVGQHSACSRAWLLSTSPATPEEYAPLLRELQKVYSDVTLVVRKRTHWERTIHAK